jgi:hypothetical protein
MAYNLAKEHVEDNGVIPSMYLGKSYSFHYILYNSAEVFG